MLFPVWGGQKAQPISSRSRLSQRVANITHPPIHWLCKSKFWSLAASINHNGVWGLAPVLSQPGRLTQEDSFHFKASWSRSIRPCLKRERGYREAPPLPGICRQLTVFGQGRNIFLSDVASDKLLVQLIRPGGDGACLESQHWGGKSKHISVSSRPARAT